MTPVQDAPSLPWVAPLACTARDRILTQRLPEFLLTLENARIAVIGLGYVGLPLAVELGKTYDTIGFDVKPARVEALRGGDDATGEVSAADLAKAGRLKYSFDAEDLRDCNVYIVAVPTPVDAFHQPNLRPLISASELVASVISEGDVVIFESTVYPGATEEDCVPAIEKVSGLVYNESFFAGYSPERINPGDKLRPLTKIVKVTSGSTPEVATFVNDLYASIITAGTFKASSIRVAEASKIIENTQRDVNIALINELSILFSHMGIDTTEVLEAASTKWNFVNLRPGLVGGHCIGVDPYYLVHKSIASGYIPDIIRLSREINDGMARSAVARLVKCMIRKNIQVGGAKVLVLGLTFKENCPDIRNTKVVDLLGNLSDYGMKADVYDSWADPHEVHEEYGLTMLNGLPEVGRYDVVILAVAHKEFVAKGAGYFNGLLHDGGVFFDMKSAFAASESSLRL